MGVGIYGVSKQMSRGKNKEKYTEYMKRKKSNN